MKKFTRSMTGKALTFLLCILSACTLAAGVLSVFAIFELDFYSKDEAAIREELIADRVTSEMYRYLWDSAGSDSEHVINWNSDALTFIITDENDRIIARSQKENTSEDWEYTLHYVIFKDSNGDIRDLYRSEEGDSLADAYLTVSASINRDGDNIYTFMENVMPVLYSMRYSVYLYIFIAAVILVLLFITLMSAAGRSNEDDGLHPGLSTKIPFDVLLAGSGMFCIFIIVITGEFLDTLSYPLIGNIILAAACFLAVLIILLRVCMVLAIRIKEGTLIKGSLTYLCIRLVIIFVKYIFRFFYKIIKDLLYLISNIPLVMKTVIAIVVLTLYELTFFSHRGALFWLFEKLLLIPLTLYIAISLRKLQKGGEALATGDLSYSVATDRLVWDFKKHGENLNSIANGMSIAVNEQLKSERMKTELITNVSHDIKTPLTSIINYADFIGKEETDNEKIQEYSSVLLRQSEKLKRLIDDLVEASKASTGNLEVELTPCVASVFISQAQGEYQDRLSEANLELITSLPQEEFRIMADGRRMWRIFDNLMNNVAKYAQPNTRVYFSLEKIDDQAVFTIKNTSRDPLNISEEELMERFTRGDRSRNTEGNGLGLSIARSMAELQKGTLNLSIDGDLFKAILRFPVL